MVYSTPVVARMTDRVPRCVTASSESGNAMRRPRTSAHSVNVACSRRRASISEVWSLTQLQSIQVLPSYAASRSIIRGGSPSVRRPAGVGGSYVVTTAPARGTPKIPRRDRLGGDGSAHDSGERHADDSSGSRQQALPERNRCGARTDAGSPRRRGRRARRPVRLRKDDAAAHDQPADRADERSHLHRERGRDGREPRVPASTHRLRDPADRAVPAPDDRTQRRDGSEDARMEQATAAGARRGAARPRGARPCAVPRPLSPSTLGRATATRRCRARARGGSAGAVDGRAIRRHRPDHTHAAPGRVPSPAGRSEEDRRVRHTRRRGSGEDGRSHRDPRHRRRARAVRRTVTGPRAPGQRLRRVLRRRRSRDQAAEGHDDRLGPAGASADGDAGRAARAGPPTPRRHGCAVDPGRRRGRDPARSCAREGRRGRRHRRRPAGPRRGVGRRARHVGAHAREHIAER